MVAALLLALLAMLVPQQRRDTSRVLALANGLALTPPMGWNSWYGFKCHIDQNTVMDMADALVSTGMKAAGYRYVNLDDCWQSGRASDGTIQADAGRFPDGIKALADYVHGRGLLFGVYTDAGSTTCMGKPGSLGHEQQDADTYAQWGVDFVKVDWCATGDLDPEMQYAKMRDALAASGSAYHHPMIFSICEWGVNDPSDWGPSTGHMWRTSGDIGIGDDQWEAVLQALDQNAQNPDAAGPGAWNDPDVLQVGLDRMSDIEDRAQFSMWAIMAAPLLVADDLRSMPEYTRQTFTNADVIAIDQDPAGVQGRLIQQDGTGERQVWSKTLQAPGARAVALFNRGLSPATVSVQWTDIGLDSGAAIVQDLWAGSAPELHAGGYSAEVPSHAVVLLKVTGKNNP